jgi:acetyl esterase/lipase
MIDLVYKLPDTAGININKNIIYKKEDNRALSMDIYYPPEGIKPSNGTVILLHGSAPLENIKDIAIFQSWGKLLASHGFPTIAFNWRPEEDPSDVRALVEYVRENSKELMIDADNLCLFAFSAGVEKGIAEAMKINTNFIKKIVAYYGQLDPEILSKKTFQVNPDVMIAMGAKDDIFDKSCNDIFIGKAREKGWKVTSIEHSEGEHGFDAFNDDLETYSIIEKTLEFIKA